MAAAATATAVTNNEVNVKEAESGENGKHENVEEVNLVQEEVTQTEELESKAEATLDEENPVDKKPAEATPTSPHTTPVFVPKYKYTDDQWSPWNKSGKKCYDIVLLEQIKEDPLSKMEPNAPLLKAYNVFKLMDAVPMGSGDGDSRNRQNPFMDNVRKTSRTTTFPVDMSKLKQVTQKSLNNMKLVPHPTHLKDQWSPWNKSGKKCYDNELLEQIKEDPLSKMEPNAPLLKTYNVFKLMDAVPMGSGDGDSRNSHNPFMDNVCKTPRTTTFPVDMSKLKQVTQKSLNNIKLVPHHTHLRVSGGGSSGSVGEARWNRSQGRAPAAASMLQETITDEKMRKSVKSTIDLCLINPDNDELVKDVKQLFPPQYHAAVVREILNIVLKTAPKQVALVANSLLHLVSTNTISAENFLAGLTESFEYAPATYIYLRIPMLYDNLAKFVAPQIEKKHITLVQTFNLSKSIIAANHGHLLLKAIICNLNESMGPTFVKSIWQESGLLIREWMDEDQVAVWIKDNKFEFFEGGDNATTPPQEHITDEKMRKYIKYMIDLCLINPDNDELVTNVKQFFPPQYHAAVVSEILNVVLEKAPKQVALVTKSLLHLVSTNTISADNFLTGLKETFEFAPDLYIDIHMLYDYLAKIVAPQIEKKHITLVQTFNLCESIIAADHGHLLLKAIINHLTESKGPTFVKSKWQESGLQLIKWMNEDQVAVWIKDNKFEFLEGGDNATTPPQEPITNEKMRKYIKYMIDFCLIKPDNDELVADVKQLFPPQYHAAVVSEILNVVLEMAPKQVALVTKSLLHLVSTNTISADNFLTGLKDTFEFAPDLYIDLPILYDYLAKIVAPQIEKKHITLVQTFNLCESIIVADHGHLLLKAIINNLNESKGPTFVKSKWQESGLQLSKWMNEDQVAKWIKDNKFEFLEGGVNATTPPQEPITDENMMKSVKSTIDLCLINPYNDELVTDVKQLFPPKYLQLEFLQGGANACEESEKVLTPAECQSSLHQLMYAGESCDLIKDLVQAPQKVGGGPPPGTVPQSPSMKMSGPSPHGVHPEQSGHGPTGATTPPSVPPTTLTPPNEQPLTSSPMQRSLPAPGPDNMIALQHAIDSMEEKGLQEDPRHSRLLELPARSNASAAQDPPKGMFSNNQLCQLNAQITANQSLSQQIAMAAGKRTVGAPPECPTPPAQPPYGEEQGPPPGGAEQKVDGAGMAGDPARGGGDVSPTPLPSIGQMAAPTQLTPHLLSPIETVTKPDNETDEDDHDKSIYAVADDGGTQLTQQEAPAPSNQMPGKKVLLDEKSTKTELPQKCTRNVQNEFEIFGMHVTTQLRLLSAKQAIIAQEEIQSILTRGRLRDLEADAGECSRRARSHLETVNNDDSVESSEDIDILIY